MIARQRYSHRTAYRSLIRTIVVSLARLIAQQCLVAYTTAESGDVPDGGVAADIEPSTPMECRDRSTQLGSLLRVFGAGGSRSLAP